MCVSEINIELTSQRPYPTMASIHKQTKHKSLLDDIKPHTLFDMVIVGGINDRQMIYRWFIHIDNDNSK